MTRNQAGGREVCLHLDLSPAVASYRLAGDLIEACVPCPTQPCPGRSPIDSGEARPILADVRGGFPNLPISLHVVALDETTYHYAVRPTDTPEEIQRAFAACPTPTELDALGPTIGWDLVRWISLNDEIAVTRRPHQRPQT